MKRKTFRGKLTLKAADAGGEGEFTAVFATLGVKDLDGDVTIPGAFQEGQEVRIARWGHNWGDLPVGKGTIHADEKEAWVDGQFFMDTQGGQEHYKTVKALGDLQEWSYGFDILEEEPGEVNGEPVRFLKSLDVFEVSPVLLGAGIDTRTEAIKGLLDALSGKVGRRHSAKDEEMIQTIHDYACHLGAKCAQADESETEPQGSGEDEARESGGSEGKSSARPRMARARATIMTIEQRNGEVQRETQ
jgi:HK97 family phage prohead protease